MCRRIDCRTCGKPTWSGCGMHVEQALEGVPPSERCQCREARSKGRAADAPAEPRSWLGRLLGG